MCSHSLAGKRDSSGPRRRGLRLALRLHSTYCRFPLVRAGKVVEHHPHALPVADCAIRRRHGPHARAPGDLARRTSRPPEHGVLRRAFAPLSRAPAARVSARRPLAHQDEVLDGLVVLPDAGQRRRYAASSDASRPSRWHSPASTGPDLLPRAAAIRHGRLEAGSKPGGAQAAREHARDARQGAPARSCRLGALVRRSGRCGCPCGCPCCCGHSSFSSGCSARRARRRRRRLRGRGHLTETGCGAARGPGGRPRWEGEGIGEAAEQTR